LKIDDKNGFDYALPYSLVPSTQFGGIMFSLIIDTCFYNAHFVFSMDENWMGWIRCL